MKVPKLNLSWKSSIIIWHSPCVHIPVSLWAGNLWTLCAFTFSISSPYNRTLGIQTALLNSWIMSSLSVPRCCKAPRTGTIIIYHSLGTQEEQSSVWRSWCFRKRWENPGDTAGWVFCIVTTKHMERKMPAKKLDSIVSKNCQEIC
jgi:hypothetical protein